MDNLTPDTMASLFRLDGEVKPGSFHTGGKVREGRLEDMVKHAMEDPTAEYWRYSIATDGPGLIDSHDIAEVHRRFQAMSS